jgi:hypothetical protein
VTGFAGVMSLVLLATVVGSSILMWSSPLWRETKRSFFTIWSVLMAALFAWPAWLAARAGTVDGDGAATLGTRLTLLTAVLVTLAMVCFLVRWQVAGRMVGIAAAVASVVALLAFAPTGRQGTAVASFQLLAGAAFLGAAYSALFLGHWYLTDRKLTRAPINRFTMALIVATVIEIAAIISGGFSGTAPSQAFNPLLTAGALAPWIAIGMAGTTLLIAVLARAALRGERASAVQSATGFFYLSLVTAYTAEIAVTTRFFAT